MMPAASNKVESKASPEAMDASKQYLNALEKKVRNIEKRKAKLDAVRLKQAAGETLEKEQQEAVKQFDTVASNLEFVRELMKTFTSLSVEIEKQQKKQGKREKVEKAASDQKRAEEIIRVQTTLNALGSDRVREDFKTGKYGAVVLTEDNLTSLDELFQLLNPSREGEEDFQKKLTPAGEHLISLLEARDRPVAGATYKELNELIGLINSCGYFERAAEAEKVEAEQAEEVEEEKEEEESSNPMAPSSSETFNDVQENELQDTPTLQTTSDLEENSLPHTQVMQSAVAPQEVPNSSFFTQTTTSSTPTPQFQPPQSQPPPQPAAAKVRPLPEIMSSVRGTFNFLQESEIELDSPHNDPAVVVAQPMMRPPSANTHQPPQTNLLPTAFSAPPMVDPPCDSEAQDPLSLSQQSMTQSSLDFSGASQSFAQAGLSHSQNLSAGVVPEALFQSSVEDSSPASQQHSGHGGMMGQQRGTAESTTPQFDLPPSIPMPPSQSQDNSQLAGQQEKKFQLNASATEFQSRSMYHSQMPPNMQNLSSQPPPNQPQPSHQQNNQSESRPLPPSTVNADFPSAPNFAQAAGDFSQAANNFQSGGFQQRGGRGGGPSGYRGGQRGGGRGANNNGNAMQNGFNGRPQNGNGGRPNNRGGASFQGFPPRNDYRPDGYQGYNANNFGGGPAQFQKRGGGAGGQGFPRGGNNRGAAGMRGGPPRGAGGPPRGAGGNRGGMNRPNNQ